ncbi:hypothetical protein GCM10011501_18600 [Thalassotalea profundi]|uniref:Uncharacterized protein n=1 Tax=Thalassotalea profundi TaxID=2036687 RepID=A0ABQ3IN70_9GAMM|nr:hypothetical protein GCM10011501_18600 [Thalassotalea profundi]
MTKVITEAIASNSIGNELEPKKGLIKLTIKKPIATDTKRRLTIPRKLSRSLELYKPKANEDNCTTNAKIMA